MAISLIAHGMTNQALARGATLSDTDLDHATLGGANLPDAVLTGARFCNSTMPDGSTNNAGC
jgi:uncharacterized protein YjbI with pentapeptide repeats